MSKKKSKTKLVKDYESKVYTLWDEKTNSNIRFHIYDNKNLFLGESHISRELAKKLSEIFGYYADHGRLDEIVDEVNPNR